MRTPQHGYSLLELFIALGLVALLALVATASFSTLLANGRIGTEINALLHSVHVARQQSLSRRTVIALCPADASSQCRSDDDWSDGWMLFANTDGDEPPNRDANEAVLRHHQPDHRVRITANRHSFSLRAIERRSTNGTIIVCDRQQRGAARALVISYTGRPRVAAAPLSIATRTCARQL